MGYKNSHKMLKSNSVEFRLEVAYQYRQCPVKMTIVWNNNVCVVLKRLNQLLVYRHHMMLIAIKHIVHVIASFYLITFYSPPKLHIIFCLNKHLEIELFFNFG